MAVTIDQLVQTFIKIRNAKADARAAFEKEEEVLNNNMRVIENELLKRAQEQNLTAFATEFGTAYRRETQHASIGDRGTFTSFLQHEDDPFGYFEQRPSLARCKEYMKDHDGNAPPGVHVFREFRMGIRKSKKKGEPDNDD